jgi:hypothetical protein
MRQVTDAFARQEAGIGQHEDVGQLEAAAVATIEAARAERVPVPPEAQADLDRFERYRAFLTSVFPCPTCRPAQFKRWRNGCYRPNHVRQRCSLCTPKMAEAR